MTTTTHYRPRLEYGQPGLAPVTVSPIDITRRYGSDGSAVDAPVGVSEREFATSFSGGDERKSLTADAADPAAIGHPGSWFGRATPTRGLRLAAWAPSCRPAIVPSDDESCRR
jgi:hypothetical protein